MGTETYCMLTTAIKIQHTWEHGYGVFHLCNWDNCLANQNEMQSSIHLRIYSREDH